MSAGQVQITTGPGPPESWGIAYVLMLAEAIARRAVKTALPVNILKTRVGNESLHPNGREYAWLYRNPVHVH